MPTTVEPSTTTPETDLHRRILDAIQDKAAPLSQLLRLMWALDADQDAANENEALRVQLRARIGAPFPA